MSGTGRPSKVVAGQRYGKLVVTTLLPERSSDGHRVWACQCNCGEIAKVRGSYLRSGTTKSCGCSHYQIKHGRHNTREYISWVNMIQRCLNPKHPSYKDYGGRGIAVCEEWMEFENFFADMGKRPPGKTLERKDNEKGYELDNCIWATADEQNRNSRRNVFFTHANTTLCLADWAAQVNKPKTTIWWHFYRGTLESYLQRIEEENK